MPIATHDRFFNILLADFFNGLEYEIENIFLSTNWHLLSETRVRVIKEMLNVLGMRHKQDRNKINLVLSLVSALATDITKEESQVVVDKVLDIIKDKKSQFLRKLHNQLPDDMQLTLMEDLIAFLKNKKRKQEVKKAIIVLITELHKSGTIIPSESLIPVIHQLIKRKSTHLNLLTSICHFLFQIKEASSSECNAAVVLDLIDKVKDESIPLQNKTILYESIFSLRYWLPEPQRSLLAGEILDALLLLQKTNSDKESYHILVVLMRDFFNTNERIRVIKSLIRKVDDPDRDVRNRMYSLIRTYADHMISNEKIHLLSRLYVLAHSADDDYSNDAKSRFIDISNVYHQELNHELTVKVLQDNADQHELPLPNELTEHILSFTRHCLRLISEGKFLLTDPAMWAMLSRQI